MICQLGVPQNRLTLLAKKTASCVETVKLCAMLVQAKEDKCKWIANTSIKTEL